MEMLNYGVPYTIADAAIRALPSAGGHLFVSPSTATSVNLSNSATMANPVPYAIASGGMFGTFAYSNEAGSRVSATFIQVVGGSAIVKITKP